MLRRGLLLVWLGVAAAGCQKEQPVLAPPKAPEVVVERAVSEYVTDYEEFTGRTEAVKTVDVRAHVSGYLEQVNFKEGGLVHEGDVLFLIDPRPFQAEVDRTQANVGQADAHLRRLEADFHRAQEMMARRSLGREEYDKISGDLAEARSMLESARAARNTARLNLNFCRITSPVTGRISRRNVDPGNMVKENDTSLTLIVTQDPMYATFDVDERTFRRIQRYLEQQGGNLLEQLQKMPVFMGLVDEEGFPHEGRLNFVDNRVDPTSVSVWLRGVFPNPGPTFVAQRAVAALGLVTPTAPGAASALFPNPRTLLTAGLTVRVLLPLGEPHRATLIPERALATDQGQKYVYVVNDQNEAIYNRVEVGEQHGQRRVVTSGVEPGERVIVSGLQRVRPLAKVQPQDEAEAAKAAASAKPAAPR
jgi:RND family efflux transporter MFP subunit